MFDLDHFARKRNLSPVLTAFGAETFPSLEAVGSEPQKKGIRQIDPVSRNNCAAQTVYRWEGSAQSLGFDDRMVSEHMTMAGNGLNKLRERRKD